MKQAYEKTNGSLGGAFEPSDDYLSAKIEEFESAEPAASPLHEVTSKKTVRTQGLQTTIDKGGQVRIVKQKQKGQPPQGTEELRCSSRGRQYLVFHGREIPQCCLRLQRHVARTLVPLY